MSLQVSYKKQTIFGLLLLVVILVVIEGISNFWWYEINRCAFEKSEIFKNLDEKVLRQLCLENYDLQYTDTEIFPQRYPDDPDSSMMLGDERKEFVGLVTINSDGFRGQEISKANDNNLYRIFTVGGSTTFGSGVMDDQTFPFYLQERFKESAINNVEVINAGIGGAWSLNEIKLVKERLLEYDPNLIIVYDGWNDVNYNNINTNNHIKWKDRWVEICQLGKQQGFETIIILQPFLGTGDRVLTEQESMNYFESKMNDKVKRYHLYAQQLPKLSNHCAEIADFRNIFDSVTHPIYFDLSHVGPKGNELIATHVYDLSVSVVVNNHPIFNNDTDNIIFNEQSKELTSNNKDSFMVDVYQTLRKIISEYKSPKVITYLFSNMVNQINYENFKTEQEISVYNTTSLNFKYADLSDKNFKNWNLTKATFYSADLSNTNFENASLNEADFRFAKFKNTILSGADLNGADFSFAEFVGMDLSRIKFNNNTFVGVDFSQSNLEGFDFFGKDLTYSNFSNTNLSIKNMKDAILVNSNMTSANLSGVDLSGADLTRADLRYADLSGADLSGADLTRADLSGAILNGADLSRVDLNRADLRGAILNGANLSEADLYRADLNGAKLDNAILFSTILGCFGHTICNPSLSELSLEK